MPKVSSVSDIHGSEMMLVAKWSLFLKYCHKYHISYSSYGSVYVILFSCLESEH